MKILFTSILFACIAISSAYSQWTQVSGGPYGGNVVGVAVSGSNLFAATNECGLLRSTDDGKTWIPQKENGSIFWNNVSSITVIGETILVSNSIRSTDNGDTWKKISEPSTYRINSTAVLGTVIYQAVDIFSSGKPRPVLLRSMDYGDSWDSVTTLKKGIKAVTVKDTTIFVATIDGYVYHSKDSCKTWIAGAAKMTEGEISKMITHGTTLFAVSIQEGMFRSTDNGDSWSHVNLPTQLDIMNLTSNGTTLFISMNPSGAGALKSTDNGDTWVALGNGMSDLAIRSITSSGTTTYLGVLGSVGYNNIKQFEGGGIFRSTDNGMNWIRIGVTTTAVIALAMNGNTMFAGAESEGVFRSTDGGKTMNRVAMENTSCYSVFIDGTTVFAGGDSGVIRSMDNGDTWKQLENIGSVRGFIKKGVFLLAGTSSGIYRSSDNGDTWEQVKLTQYINSFAVDENEIFAAGAYGLSRSTDSGKTWNDFGENVGYNAIAVIGKVIFAAGLNSYHSADYGNTWVKLLTEDIITACAVKGKTIYTANRSKEVEISSDIGQTWKKMWKGDPPYLSQGAYSLLINNETLFVGSNVSGLWGLDLSTLEVSEKQGKENIQGLFVCYPNPATSTLTIDRTNLHFPENTPVQYTLSTLIGGKVMEFDNSDQKFTVSLEGLASGVYSLTAEQGMNRVAVMVTVVE